MLVGVVAPLLLTIFVEHLSPWEPAAHSRHAQHAQQHVAAVSGDHCWSSPWARVRRCCERLDAALKSSRAHLACSPALACFTAWVVLGNLWVAAVALAQLHLSQ